MTINPEDKGVAMSSEYWAETDIVVLAKEALVYPLFFAASFK